MKKVVLKVDLHSDKEKKKAMKAVSSLTGINSIAMDMRDKKMTVVGDVDPVDIVRKVRKCNNWHVEILTVGPAKEEKKDEKKEEWKMAEACKGYCPPTVAYYYPPCPEEKPNSCVIC